MDLLQGMKVFVRVAQRSGFAAAARDLRMSPGAVTKNIAALEEHLGTRLFDRTTRRVGITEAGHLYLERCQECLQAIEDADASVSGPRVRRPLARWGGRGGSLAREPEDLPALFPVREQRSNRNAETFGLLAGRLAAYFPQASAFSLSSRNLSLALSRRASQVSLMG